MAAHTYNLDEVLSAMGIWHEGGKDATFESLGLVGYSAGRNVLTFLAAPKYANGLTDDVSALLVSSEMRGMELGCSATVVENPRVAFFQMNEWLGLHSDGYAREEFPTRISPSAQISPLAYIAPNNVVIDDDVVIEEFCSVKANTTIGKGSVLRTGCTVGGIGFEVKKLPDGGAFVAAHLGGVIIGREVEIQQGTCIDRAIYPWDDTVIGDYTKTDNLVHIAHGCKIGRRVEIAAGAVISGRVVIGEDAWVGPGVVIRNGIALGARSRANMGSVVSLDVPDDEAVTGNFAIPHARFMANLKESVN